MLLLSVSASYHFYSGVNLDLLDLLYLHDLHDLLFVRYLEERGFDAQFCKTLVAYATHYEHSQYVGLLNKIKAFVSK
ncbi:hypothetical protein ANCCAN_17357 [Ancylostoma caninum]|uniref:Uncharacterized protein n=1 Tax=Ancylostoma caninum TaxID=29170 RepID=A0A368G151_ANCCA|nr:hypothetical protein ANCCAN_17357 [Ancylostoma caninum]